MRCALMAAALACLLFPTRTVLCGEYFDESFAAQESAVSQACNCQCDCEAECECFDCCDSCRDRLLGFLPSDHCFDDFISPLSNPFFFEDPRSLTEVRGIFIENSLPEEINGGDFQLYAAQLRGRVTDRTSIIAPRLGFFNVNQAGGGAPDGFLSAPVGVKYNFIRDVDRQLLVTAGITYFIKGSSSALANFGEGDLHFFLTGGKQIGQRAHWLSGTGFRIPVDNQIGTQMWYWSNQWDYQVFNGVYAVTGVNWFHWMRSSPLNFPSPVTGLDVLNMPVTGVAGRNVVSGVVGLKLKPSPNVEIGTGYEFPMTDRTDILGNRLYADLIFRY